MNQPRVVLLPIARTTFDIELAKEVSDSARKHLSQMPVILESPLDLITDLQGAQRNALALSASPPDLLIIFQATFADSLMIMSLVKAIDAPILLWAIPEEHTGGRLRLNSFCGINLACHALTRSGYHYDYIFAAPDDPNVLEKIASLAKAGHTRNLLRQSRLGRVGENPDGFETCLLDPDLIQRIFGLEVVQYNLTEDIFPLARKIESDQINTIQAQLSKKVVGLEELDPSATRGTLSVYAALSQLAQQQGLGGFAVRCWPEFFTEMGCAACGAMSMMSDELIPCSCEADVNGTITQMILQSLSGEPAFGTDMVSLDEERDALVIWHCGLAPLSMADPREPSGVTLHSNRKLPLLFDFTLKPGPVTIARLTESSGEYRLVIGRGEMIQGPKSFSGTSGLLHFDRPAREILDVILTEGLEHHISITYGDHTDELITYAKLINIPILLLTN
ncbi:MAG: L-fucose/L-arabinose isomerase family protein [Anaerolineaceae bacterium]|nr:L-fucose/L-arabinose isomerase family protein [Anaerolineaceae bacterium]